ncbi:glycosyltransferase [Candidatus Margulisiibacteriota bacterium]
MKTKLIVYMYSLANWGGAENIIFKLCNYLQNTKLYDITVVGLVDEQPSLEKDLERLSIKTISLKLSDKRSVLLQLPTLFKLLRILRRENPDILLNVLFPCILTGGILGKLAGIKHIIGNLHGPAYFKKSIAIVLDRLVSRFYEGYIAVAPHIKDQFSTREKIPAKKITVIQNGLEQKKVTADFEKNKLRAKFGIGKTDLVLGTIGRIYPEKNQKYLVDIGQELLKQVKDLKLLIVGDGPKFEELKKYITERNMNEHCILPGWQSTTADFLNIMELFVLPSHYEGMPCSILEAWQQKIPVVGTAVPGIKDLVIDNKDALLIPKDNAALAADQIMTLLSNRDQITAMVNTGYQNWKEKYTVDKMCAGYNTYLQKILGNI